MARDRQLRRARVGLACLAVLLCAAVAIGLGQSAAPQMVRATLKPMTRAPQAEIQRHVDREWVKTSLVNGLLDYWLKYSIEPNGFIQENLVGQIQLPVCGEARAGEVA